jgi:hypothetical protein
MWLDVSEDKEFFNIFGLTEDNLPKVAILNAGKRKRYLVHNGDITEGSLSSTLDKILGGDAKFTNVAGNAFP